MFREQVRKLSRGDGSTLIFRRFNPLHASFNDLVRLDVAAVTTQTKSPISEDQVRAPMNPTGTQTSENPFVWKFFKQRLKF
ncbi:MAG: hypothetical protein AAFU85_24845 [Planctomycetota bacterium]